MRIRQPVRVRRLRMAQNTYQRINNILCEASHPPVMSKQLTGPTIMSSEFTGHRLIDLAEVVRRTGLSRSTIYNYIAAGLFPRPRKLGPRRVAWLDTEIDGWIAERPAA